MSTIPVPIPALRESLRKNQVKKEGDHDEQEEEETGKKNECVIPSSIDPFDLEPSKKKDQHEEGGSVLIASETVNVTSGIHDDTTRPDGCDEKDDGNPFHEEDENEQDQKEDERDGENEVKINQKETNEVPNKTHEISKRVDDEESDHNNLSKDPITPYSPLESIDGSKQDASNRILEQDGDDEERTSDVQVTAPVQPVINDEKNEINASRIKTEATTRLIDDKDSEASPQEVQSDGPSNERCEVAKASEKKEDQIKPVIPEKPKKMPKIIYPTDLNPFGEDEDGENEEQPAGPKSVPPKINYPGDLNPFGEEEEKDQEACAINKSSKDDYDKSMNPFGDEEDEVDVNQVNPIPKPRRKNRTSSSRPSSEIVQPSPLKSVRVAPPIPGKPIHRPNVPPPRPPQSEFVRSSLNGSIRSSDGNGSSSPTPVGRTRPPVSPRSGTPKRKPPAPKPPSSGTSSLHQSPVPDRNISSLSNRASTPSPILCSPLKHETSVPGTPETNRSGSFALRRPSVSSSVGSSSLRSEPNSFVSCNSEDDEKSKTLTPNPVETKLTSRPIKRQAPAPPSATRRTVVGSLETIQADLNSIGDRLAEIQVQMKLLEESFANNPEYSDTLVYNYLDLLRETCSLARKQEELMYQKREHKLEQEHADIEFEIRDIEIKPHFKRTPEDDERVQQLLQRLIEVIDERNDVVENMTRINKRPDFDRGLDKLKKLTSSQVVEKVLPKFMEENDISVIETKIIPCNNIFHVSPPAKETEEERKARKREEKEKMKREKKERREAKKASKKEAKEKEEMEKFARRLSIDAGDRDSKLSSETASVGGDSLKKDKKKSPLKAIKKLGSTLVRSSSTKRQSAGSHSKESPIKDGQQSNLIIPPLSRPPITETTSVGDEESESKDESQVNSESHLI